MRYIFMKEIGEINKLKSNRSTSVSTDGYDRVDFKPSLIGQKLTEREWRRPLTWLDRFRDAVLLPASWRDENIQRRVGNKYGAKVILQMLNISRDKNMFKLNDVA